MEANIHSEKASIESPTAVINDVPEKHRKYFLGAQGRALRNQISIAGAIGFLLFGYDQGVLSVSEWTIASL